MVFEKNARSGNHNIRHGFRKHIEHAIENGGYVCGAPLTLLKPQAENPTREVRGYLDHKLRGRKGNLGKVNSLDHPSQCEVLTKLYSDPNHLGRKITNLFCIDNACLDASTNYLDRYRQIAPDLAEQLELFLADREDYMQQVYAMRESMDDWPHQRYKEDVVNRIRRLGIPMINFFNANYRLINTG
jgi:hypothetical protein